MRAIAPTATTMFRGLSYMAKRLKKIQRQCFLSEHAPSIHCSLRQFVPFCPASEGDGLHAIISTFQTLPRIEHQSISFFITIQAYTCVYLYILSLFILFLFLGL